LLEEQDGRRLVSPQRVVVCATLSSKVMRGS
jgi:hypothetical protein